jgi:hypothetical protein
MSLTRLQELVQEEIKVMTEEGWADCCCVTDIGNPSWEKDAVMDFIIMYVCMCKGWAFTALAPRPTVVYCA